jgi:predicted membrane protein
MEENAVNNFGDELSQEIRHSSVVDEDRLKKFNWAAFFGGAIWSVWHKQYLIFVLCLIPYEMIISKLVNQLVGDISNFVIGLSIAYYLGKHGYKMAWGAYKDKYQSVEGMFKNQKSWLRVFLIIYITLTICIVAFAIMVGIEMYNEFNGKVPTGFWGELINQWNNYKH